MNNFDFALEKLLILGFFLFFFLSMHERLKTRLLLQEAKTAEPISKSYW